MPKEFVSRPCVFGDVSLLMLCDFAPEVGLASLLQSGFATRMYLLQREYLLCAECQLCLHLFASVQFFYCISKSVHVWRHFIVLKRGYYKSSFILFFKIVFLILRLINYLKYVTIKVLGCTEAE